MNKKVVLVKAAVTIVTGVAVAAVATAAIKNVVPMEDLTKFNKVMFGLGTIIISGMVAEAGSNYTGTLIDAFIPAAQPDSTENPA